MGKTIVCRCEDVSLEDLEEAFEAGYHDIESLKRYTGFGTGFCQGKSCTAHAARFLSALVGGDDVVADPPRTRPLLHPTPAARFMNLSEEGQEGEPADEEDREDE